MDTLYMYVYILSEIKLYYYYYYIYIYLYIYMDFFDIAHPTSVSFFILLAKAKSSCRPTV